MFHSQNHAVVHKESMTGQEIIAENTANAPLEMRIYGASQQEQSEQGKNLLDPAWGNFTSQTLSGITMTRQNDLLVLDGTCTYGNGFFVFGSMDPPYLGYPYTLKAGKTYRLSKTVVSGTAENNQTFEVVISTSDLDGSNRVSYGLRAESRTIGPYDVDKRINFWRFDVYKGTILSDYTLAVQLEEGEEATAYEPFTPNSPSPDYPSEIVSAVDFEVGSNTAATINQPLRGIPDGSGGWVARDYIEVKDGAARYVKRIDDSVLGETVKLEEQTGAIMATPAITDITATDLGGALLSMKSVQYYTRIYHTSALPVELEATITKLGSDRDILGVQVDFENNRYERLAAAKGHRGGSDFDSFRMFGGRRRCNLSDDGRVLAYYGDDNYSEDGSNGQVMVEQPKFYYRVEPLLVERIRNGEGYHLRKANYYISEEPKEGFKLHPAFIKNGIERDYIYLSAYEGCLWDTDGGESGTGGYNLDDAQVADWETDKLSSIAGAKPMSGLTQLATRANIEKAAANRGAGWHCDLIEAASANQLLMMVEMGTLNSQTAIGQGVVSIADNSAYNCASLTGSTSGLGNATGQAAETINEQGGTQTVETTAGKTSVTYRGMENPWGNIWKFVEGINFYGNGNMGGGQPYICTDYNFAESMNNGNYVGAGFTIANANGYVSAMGYSTDCDWLFLPSETLGNSSLPVGDYAYVTPNLDGYRIARLGGGWTYGGDVGGLCWYASNGVGIRYRSIGARLVFVPDGEGGKQNVL